MPAKKSKAVVKKAIAKKKTFLEKKLAETRARSAKKSGAYQTHEGRMILNSEARWHDDIGNVIAKTVDEMQRPSSHKKTPKRSRKK